MDTNSKKNKKSIANRITLVQVLTIVLVSLSVLLSASLTLSDYIMQRNYYELDTTANALVQIVKNTGMRDYALVEALIDNNGIGHRDTNVVILDYRLFVKLSTLPELFNDSKLFPTELRSNILSGDHRGTYKGYFYVAAEINNITGDVIGYVLTLSTQQELILIRNSIISTVLRIIFVALLLGVLFSGYITQRLIEPLQKLENRIREIGSGEFAGQIEVTTDDEIGDVTRAFNSMSQQLEQYHKAQSRFIQNASHELKSPLMNIQGYAEGLQEEIFNDLEQSEALQIIIDESQRLKNVVEELLYISKIDDVDSYLTFAELSIADVVNDAIRTVYTRITQRRIELDVQVDDDLTIYASYDDLVRAISNVLDNATRYAKYSITINVEETETTVCITISDDGPGFDEEDLPNIFERFYKGKSGNTGLGMAIVADIIDLHHGRISAANDSDVGAVVTIELPKTIIA